MIKFRFRSQWTGLAAGSGYERAGLIVLRGFGGDWVSVRPCFGFGFPLRSGLCQQPVPEMHQVVGQRAPQGYASGFFRPRTVI